MKKIKTAVFPVGGLGTRFLPATKSMPKEMLTVVDKPLIQYAFEEAKNAGIEQFIFITGRNKTAIEDHFDNAYELESVLNEREKEHLLSLAKDWLPPAGNIAFIRQQNPLGLGHAVYCAKNFIGDEPFAVILADEMFLSEGKSLLQNMIEQYENTGGNVLGVAEVPQKDVNKYGIVTPSPEYTEGDTIPICDMVEKPAPENAPSNISIVGRYILQPQIFDYLSKGKKGQGGEIQLTDAIKATMNNVDTYGVKFTGKRIDCGGHRGFLEANIAFALKNPASKEYVEQMLREFLE